MAYDPVEERDIESEILVKYFREAALSEETTTVPCG